MRLLLPPHQLRYQKKKMLVSDIKVAETDLSQQTYRDDPGPSSNSRSPYPDKNMKIGQRGERIYCEAFW